MELINIFRNTTRNSLLRFKFSEQASRTYVSGDYRVVRVKPLRGRGGYTLSLRNTMTEKYIQLNSYHNADVVISCEVIGNPPQHTTPVPVEMTQQPSADFTSLLTLEEQVASLAARVTALEARLIAVTKRQ